VSTIKAGSFSRLQIYSECPYRAKLAFVERVPEPERPPLPDGKEYPNDRGSRIHDYAENLVRGIEGFEEYVPPLINFKEEFEVLKRLYQDGQLLMEDLWLFDDGWNSLPSDLPPYDPRIWLRIKIDAFAISQDGTRGVVIDHKTGKRYGNEIKHGEQVQLYALSVFLRFPEIEHLTTELWYLDLNEIQPFNISRRHGLKFLKKWNERMLKMTSDTEFKPNNNTHSCRFCPYKTGEIYNGLMGTGHCDLNP